MRAGSITADATGKARMPGGFSGRVASLPSSPLSYPLKATIEGSEGEPFFFIDSGPVPLPTVRRDGGQGFPNLLLTGLAAGQTLAYIVAQTELEAMYLGAGGFQSGMLLDTAGRAVVTGGGPLPVTERAEFTDLMRNGFAYFGFLGQAATAAVTSLLALRGAPLGVGKRLILCSCVVWSATAQIVRMFNGAVDALVANQVPNNLLPGGPGATSSLANGTGTAGATQMIGWKFIPANTPIEMCPTNGNPFSEAVGDGATTLGFELQGTVVNTDLNASWTFIELPAATVYPF